MSHIVENIGKYISFKNLSVREVEVNMGLGNGTLSTAIRNGKSIKTENLEIFLRLYDEVNPAWLFSPSNKHIPMLMKEIQVEQAEATESTTAKIYKLRTDRIISDQSIPLYDIEAAAGLVDLFQDKNGKEPIDTIRIPNLPKCDGAVFITGDSMYPLLKSGDIVAYKEIYDFVNDIFWGEMYLISVEVAGEEWVSVKYIQKSEKGEKYIRLVSQNQHHQPKDVLISKVRALALVKASIRINSMS